MESALAKAKNGLFEARKEVTKDMIPNCIFFSFYFLFLNSGMTHSCSHSGYFNFYSIFNYLARRY